LLYMRYLRDSQQKGVPQKLSRTLLRGLSFDATKEVDKVYALLGLAPQASSISIDYNKDFETVYEEVALYMLEKADEPSWDILSVAGIGVPRPHKLPSWVPDWSKHDRPLSLGYTPLYNATGKSRDGHRIRKGDDPSSIIASVKLIDRIKICGQPRPRRPRKNIESHSPEIFLQRCAEGVKYMDECRSIIKQTLNDQDEKLQHDVLWRTIVAGSNALLGRAPDEYGEQLESRYEQMKNAEVFYRDKGTTEGMPWTEFPFDQVYTWLETCRMFSTHKFHVGVGSGCQEGDIIALILDASVPFILREEASSADLSRKRYVIISECYIHGLMDGEGLLMGETEEIVII
jgi:hypothetical protein